jgi:hypothetical protein
MNYKIKNFSNPLKCKMCNELIEEFEHRCSGLDWFDSQNGWKKTHA